MSICSDVYITEKEARKRVRSILMSQQEAIINSAIKGMHIFELSTYLNGVDDLYYYNIINQENNLEEDT